MKRIIIISFIVLVVTVGIGAYFVFQRPAPPEPKPPLEKLGKCGDNICDEFEKANPNACPDDCAGEENAADRGAYQCPQYVPPAPSFYENCQKQGGTVSPGGKNDKGCQMPVQCVLPEESSEIIKGSKIINEDSPFGMLPFFSFSTPLREGPPPDPAQFDFKPTKDLGLKWGRAHYLIWAMVQPNKEAVDKEIYDWSDSDSVLGSYPEGFNVVENIVAFPAKRDEMGEHLENFSFPSKEVEEDCIRFVQKGVERYDGDGKGDMPGLKNPIKYWQVENEPDLKAKEDWSGYANLLKITYEGIKSVCADCQVVAGGMGGEMRGLSEFYKPVLEKLGVKYFDIFDYHCYGNKNDWEKCGRLAEEIKKSFPNYDLEIWLTETGTWSGSLAYPPGQPSQTEKDQAESIIKFYVAPLSRGVKKIFWAWGILEGLDDGPENNIFDNTGLIYDGDGPNDPGFGVKKLSYYTYKKMVEILEGSDWDNIETIQEQDDVYIYKFIKNGKPIWVAWNDNEEGKQITLSGINSSSLKITESVPNYDSGKDIEDYPNAFSTKTEGVENGKVTLKIKDRPVFVE